MIFSLKWPLLIFCGYLGLLLAGICLTDFRTFGLEVLYRMIMREMIQTGHFVIPYIYDDVIYTHKPPLFFWLGALIAKIFFQGEVHPFVVRFPSVLSAILTLLLVGGMGKKMFGRASGFLAMAVLATTEGFWRFATVGRFDMLLCFFITAALASFWQGYSSADFLSRPKRFFVWTLFYLALSGGFLAKGFIAVLLPCGIIFFFLMWERRPGFLLKMWIPWGILILLGLVGGWLLMAYREAGTKYLYERFFVHEFVRYLGSDETRPHWMMPSSPFYYYFYKFPVLCLPWTFFLPLALWRVWRVKPPQEGVVSSRRFPAVWFVLIFLFFTFSDGKGERYLLPLFPATALFLGDYFAAVWTQRRIQKIFYAVFAGVLSFMAVLLLIVNPYANRYHSYKVDAPFFLEIKKRLGEEGKIAGWRCEDKMLHYYFPKEHHSPDLNTLPEAAAFLQKNSHNLLLLRYRFLKNIEGKIPIQIVLTNQREAKNNRDDYYVVCWETANQLR